ncbi:hypothetical protein HJFPF1_01535 [Paramyrothecium foliicola]|nr:hypothetical protein HJFPF1_01535 [Paramyrothecium foliicola]
MVDSSSSHSSIPHPHLSPLHQPTHSFAGPDLRGEAIHLLCALIDSNTEMAGEVSHGRGGAGNINPDETKYVDGEVVRAGVEGSHGDGAFSSGRGGAGNITDVGTPTSERRDHDVVPDVAVRASQDNQDYHTGRGGAGNEHVANGKKDAHKYDENGAPISFADRLKAKLFGVFKK